mmetsp:Transcript_56368/g.167722  ORF Transcript_56368/g.167722 Transcript_56368/m.167722 type:complete len:421 (-) Transcript_56368:63-1325(-)
MGINSSALTSCCTVRDRDTTGSVCREASGSVSRAPGAPVAPKPPPKPPRVQCRFRERCRRGDPWHWVSECHPGDPDWLTSEPPPPPPVVLPEDSCLQPRDGSYEWIRVANGPADRDQRCLAAGLTLRAVLARGYELGDSGLSVKLKCVDTAASETRLLTSRQLGSELAAMRSSGERSQIPSLTAAPEPLALDAALARAAAGDRVALISPASAYHPGGGFRTGGRHAFEESVCMQTSLALSLQRAVWIAQNRPDPVRPPTSVALPPALREDTAEWFCYIPEDGVVFTPSVEVFRESYTTGYRFLPSPVELSAVVSVAMPNRNANVRDAPVDAPGDEEEYRAILVMKLRAALGAARLVGANVAVLPALGCGAYRNEPKDIGRALGEALCWAPACDGEDDLREVVLAGAPEELLDAAREEIGW